MKKGQTVLAIFLLLSIIAIFLPWADARVLVDGEDRSSSNNGYQYIIPLGARYTAPVAILCVIGFVLSAYSLKETQKVRMLNVLAGLLILIGAIAAFLYTSSAAMGETAGSFNYSVSVSAGYGMGLEALFGFLMLVVGARTKAEEGRVRKGAGKLEEGVPKPRQGEVLVRVDGVCKGFPGVWEHLILDNINLEVRAGEVHAILGENGAGKTVLANIMSGFYSLTKGRIYVGGKPISIKSPKDALEHGIGMVHQEFTLARPLTVAENIALGLKESNFSFPLSKVEKKVRELSERYGLKVDPKAKIEELSAGEQQRVEILKVLYHEPEVIILDEPTSVLTPEESRKLFSILRAMARERRGVVFITHKLEEVMEVSDRVTVLRLGKLVGTSKTSEMNRRELVRMMMGREVTFRPKRKKVKMGKVALEVKDLYVLNEKGLEALKGVSISIREGEILGIAGVAGNGQSELVEAITGLRRVEKGKVLVFGKDMTNHSPRKIMEAGMAHVPEERRRMGTAEGMTSAENIIMKDYRTSPFSKWTFLNRSFITQHAERMVSEYDVLIPDLWQTEARILSGGNIQRIILARETWREPRLIVAVHPTYGLDLKALKHTHDLFLRLKEKGTAILLVSEDLDEVMSLSDRIAVIFEGKIVGTVDAAKARVEKIGLMMAGSKG